MPRTPKRLAGPALITNAAATKYTTPAATKTIVRHVHVQNPSASPVTFTMSIGADAAGVRLFDAFTVPAASVLDHYCFYILETGEVIQALAGTNNIMTLAIFGEECTLG